MVLNLDLLRSTLLTYNFQGYIWNSYYRCKGPPCCKIWIHTAGWIFHVINYRSQKVFCLTKLVLSLAFHYVLSIVFLVDFVSENKYIFCYNYCKQTPMLQIATKQSNYKREKALIEFPLLQIIFFCFVSVFSDHFVKKTNPVDARNLRKNNVFSWKLINWTNIELTFTAQEYNALSLKTNYWYSLRFICLAGGNIESWSAKRACRTTFKQWQTQYKSITKKSNITFKKIQ